jgi:hypothetical protein
MPGRKLYQVAIVILAVAEVVVDCVQGHLVADERQVSASALGQARFLEFAAEGDQRSALEVDRDVAREVHIGYEGEEGQNGSVVA